MKTNDEGIKLIKSFEGCRLTAYLDLVGIWTIGYGHTKGVKKGQTITEATATAYLKEDLTESENAVNKWMNKYSFNSNEFSALVSFTFNCGAGSLNNLVKNGARTKAEIAKYITLYNKGANGKYLEGLARRRKAEKELFLKKVSETTSEPVAPQLSDDTLYKIAVDVCRGLYGDNDERVTALTKAGYDAKAVQKEVNRIFKFGYILGQTYTIHVATFLNIRNLPNFTTSEVVGKIKGGKTITPIDAKREGDYVWLKCGQGWCCAGNSNVTYIHD